MTTVAEEMRGMLGPGIATGDPRDLKAYFRKPPPRTDLTLVRPRDSFQLSDIASWAYSREIPMYTHRRGYLPPEVASSGGLLIDLTGIDRIVRIDEDNLLAFVEYGVTFERLKEELDTRGLRVLMPAAATSSSVVRTYLDRDVILANGATRPYQFTTFHAILADGRLWMSGTDQYTPDGHSEFREDLGPMYSNFFHASEDIFGMPYAMKAWIYRRWEERRVVAYGFQEAAQAVEAARTASRHDQVFECLVADRRYLSVLLTRSPAEADALAEELPPWNAVFGFDNHPALVEIWDRQTREMAEGLGGERQEGELASLMREKFEWPWYVRDREHYRGAVETVEYFTFAGKVVPLFDVTAAALEGYVLGRVAIPSYYGAAFYCETDIYHSPDDPAVPEAWFRAYREVLDRGAHVGRPRGEVARLVYSRLDPENVRMIRNLKRVLDPKGLLNPGQLMEGV
ncbi:FAD-binding protein [Candidatus Solincola tengchongensis]|uniref:FAD-binding oxidoreductase n=1 Tax=Candidatus Solincola tengchongensis TaxID=2900693 RepID=UPI00257A3883|nr:FAD-binding protein [Candidatus Solincola tengchongensis]